MKLTIIEFNASNVDERSLVREVITGERSFISGTPQPPADLQSCHGDEDDNFVTVYGTPESAQHAKDNAIPPGVRVDVSEIDDESQFEGKTLEDVLPPKPAPVGGTFTVDGPGGKSEPMPVNAEPAKVQAAIDAAITPPVNPAPSSEDIMADVLSVVQSAADKAATDPATAPTPASVVGIADTVLTLTPTPAPDPLTAVMPTSAPELPSTQAVDAKPDEPAKVDWAEVSQVLRDDPPKHVEVSNEDQLRHDVRMCMVAFMEGIGPEGITYAMEVLENVAGCKAIDDVPLDKLTAVHEAMKVDLEKRKAAKAAAATGGAA